MLLIALLLSCFTHTSFANDNTDKIAQAFFTQIGKNNIEEATKVIGNTTDAGRVKDLVEQLERLHLSFSSLSKAAGTYAGNEKIIEKTIGTRFIHVQYLAYYTAEPVHFKFSFYRYKEDWRVLDFSFNYDFSTKVKSLVDQQLLSDQIQQ